MVWQGLRRPVTGIDLRWRTPIGPAFRVSTEGGVRFELRYDEEADRWEVCALPTPESEDKEVRS